VVALSEAFPAEISGTINNPKKKKIKYEKENKWKGTLTV